MINWHEQWALFAENFYDGKAHISVGDQTLLLTPGAGFGDLSHPTTRLMLRMMSSHVVGESIIDIGTGSGILALAALLLTAKSALGIDIDPQAILHARQNAKLNGLSAQFRKILPKLRTQHIFLMNMIFSEQKAVQPAQWNPFAKLWITSGILVSQKEAYLRQTAEWGWNLSTVCEEGEWCGFLFS